MSSEERAALVARATKAELKPLADYVQRVLGDEPDLAEMGYVSRRCWALYFTLGSMAAEGARDDKDRAVAKSMLERAQEFLFVATVLDSRFNKKSAEFMVDQNNLLAFIYAQSMVESKKINNSVMSPLISRDLEIAKQLWPYYLRVAGMLRESSGDQSSK